jgi:hypothetical protein
MRATRLLSRHTLILCAGFVALPVLAAISTANAGPGVGGTGKVLTAGVGGTGKTAVGVGGSGKTSGVGGSGKTSGVGGSG